MKRSISVAIALALSGYAVSASAITDSDTNASLPFNFASPGARSLGMGGAFIGLADDATAAYANPAGLTQLRQLEVSAEGRNTDFDIPYADGGTATLNPFDTSGLNKSHATSSKKNLSFLAIVYPHDNWAIAGFRHELAHFHSDLASGGETIPLDDQFVYRVFPYASTADLRIVSYGVTGAIRMNDTLSVGLGISYYSFKFDTASARLDDRFDPAVPANVQGQHGNDNAIGASLGLRWALSDQWSTGIVYRHVPSFSYAAANVALADNNGNPLDTPVTVASFPNAKFNVPDSLGGGISFRPTDQFLLNFDVTYLHYGELTADMNPLFGSDPNFDSHLRISNGVEVHIGGEYTFAQMTHPVSIRAGAWHDPSHAISYKGDPADIDQIGIATLFGVGRRGQTHYAAGIGMAFKSFQVDLGADMSPETDTVSLSGVYRF